MTPLEEHEDRIRKLESISIEHNSRIKFLEELMERVIALTEIVADLLQRQKRDDAENGR